LQPREVLFYNATDVSMSKESGRGSQAASGLGFVLVAVVVFFAVLGYLMDRWLHTKPWLMVGGVFVGAGLGFAYMALIFLGGSSGYRDRKKGGSDDKEPGEGSS
jgi:F0F1-type ATP synthase assembly protein I